MFTLVTTPTYLELITKVSICIAIFCLGLGIGRYVQVSMAQKQLGNILELVWSILSGLKISVKQLRSDVTFVKSELTSRSLCPECLKLHVLSNLHNDSESKYLPK